MLPTPTLEEVLALAHRLPPAEQATLLARLSADIAALLQSSLAPVPPRSSRSLWGLWADLNISISSEDIDEARREMWGNFPRDDI
jgi:hypothetical protein